MALRTTFQEVIQQVRAEAKLSSNTSRGIDHLDYIKQLIRRHYYMLAEDYDWQHLEIKRDSSVSRKILQAGSRYYDFPTALNPLRIEKAWVKWGSVWLPLTYGITYNDRNALDPDADQRSDPITSWSFYGGDQFEVHPIPATNGAADGANEIAFEGQKKVEQLTSDTNRLDMDDILVSLLAAAEILAGNEKQKEAETKAQAAMARMQRLRANMGSKTRYRMGLGPIVETGNSWPRHPKYIR